MKTFREHILEKLKVTSKNFINPSYKEYFDLLDEYCKTAPEHMLDLGEIYNFDDNLLPKYKRDKSKTIFTIRTIHLNDFAIRLKVYDFTLQKSFSYIIFLNTVKDKEVDFMEDEYIEATVKYMKEHIK